jgi:hypothetical protein
MTNIDQTSQNSKSTEVSRQVRRQAERENGKRKETRRLNQYYNEFYKAGLTQALLTIPPRTKVPRIYNKDGSHGPHYGWPNGLTLEQIQIANRFKDVGIGIIADYVLGLDYDGKSTELAALIHRLADQYLGLSTIRERSNSCRFLRAYKQNNDAPLRKRVITFLDKEGKEHKLERIGKGNFWVAAGVHTSGVEYIYRDGVDLCKWGLPNLPEVGEAEWSPFKRALIEGAKALGFTVVEKTVAGGSGSNARMKLPHAAFEGDPEQPREIINTVPCDDETFPSRDEYVQVTAAFKAAAGKHADDLFLDFLEWSMNYPGAEPDWIEKIWSSIHDATIGFAWFEGWARSKGYTGGAQREFDDDKVTPEQAGTVLDPNSKSPLDRTINRYVWCQQQERYVDIQTGEMLTPKAFNAINIAVAAFGKSGTNTAEAEFQNHPAARDRKVVMATYRPGRKVLIDDTNKRGILVPAVNMWRPSNVVPAKNVTDERLIPLASVTRRPR